MEQTRKEALDILQRTLAGIASAKKKAKVLVGIQVGAALQDLSLFHQAPLKDQLIAYAHPQPYNIGSIAGLSVSVDPHMKWSDKRILDENGNVLDDFDGKIDFAKII